MLYPAGYDIRLLQNSTWRAAFRVTQSAKAVSNMSVATAVPTFTADCHGLEAGDKVVLTGSAGLPCGLQANSIYYVIASGLTTSTFRLSRTDGGTAIALTDTADGSFPVAYTIAKPVDITGYTIDCDIKEVESLTQIATFTINVLTAAEGSFELSLAPATTIDLSVGAYGYDLYMTSPGGERYYYLRGSVAVERTLSRAT